MTPLIVTRDIAAACVVAKGASVADALLLVATLTIVVALAWPSALPATATGSTSSPGSAAARMGNG